MTRKLEKKIHKDTNGQFYQSLIHCTQIETRILLETRILFSLTVPRDEPQLQARGGQASGLWFQRLPSHKQGYRWTSQGYRHVIWYST